MGLDVVGAWMGVIGGLFGTLVAIGTLLNAWRTSRHSERMGERQAKNDQEVTAVGLCKVLQDEMKTLRERLDAAEDEREQIQQEREDLRRRIEALEAEREASRVERQRLLAELATRDAQIADRDVLIEQLRGEVAGLTSRLDAMDREKVGCNAG